VDSAVFRLAPGVKGGRSPAQRLAALAFTGVTAFSNLPLRVWSGVGSAIAIAAVGCGLGVVAEDFLEGHAVPGYATLAVSLLFFSGVQLLSLGVLGENVGRIFDEVKQRHVYVVGSEVGEGSMTSPASREATAQATPEERSSLLEHTA
jgi:hypothetical protein